MRFNAPIFTYKNILDKAGIFLKIPPKKSKQNISEDEDLVIEELISGTDKESIKSSGADYSKHTLKELHKVLGEAVINEDYETAARIRDEISKR